MLAIQMNEELPAAHSSVSSEVLNVPKAMKIILDCRKDKLGKENPLTLLAMVNLARGYTALGQFDEAEALVRRGLDIADRNFGENHIGTLMGRTLLGKILTHQSRYHEAEETLRGVIERQRSLSKDRGDLHPDRIGAMIVLSWCLREQGKLEESIQICETVIDALGQISLKQHPLERKMRVQKEKMTGILEASNSE